MAEVLLKTDTARLKPSAIRNDTFFERMFLTWVYGVVWRGMRGTAKQEDLKMPGDQVSLLLWGGNG